jgi:hypothetical protein
MKAMKDKVGGCGGKIWNGVVCKPFRPCFEKAWRFGKLFVPCRGDDYALLAEDKQWRVDKLGPVSWVEIFCKGLGIGVGIASVSIYEQHLDRPYLFFGEKVAQMVFLGMVAVYYTLLNLQKIAEREIFNIGFNVLMIIAHWCLFMILFTSVDPGAFVFCFSFLMLMGEMVHAMYLGVYWKTRREAWFPHPLLLLFSAFLMLWYLIIIILQVVIYLTNFNEEL